jgi:hypothetical protein
LLAGKQSASDEIAVFVCEQESCGATIIGLSDWNQFLQGQ